MQSDLMLILITATIAALLLLIAVILFASIVRRVLHDRNYRKLDELRQEYGRRLARELGQAGRDVREDLFRAKPGTLAWQAVEYALFAAEADRICAEQAKGLFQRLGYVAHYEKQLVRRNVLVRASAIDKLGRMGSTVSTPKLLALLDEKDPEILSVTVRALGRIGTEEALKAVLRRLPHLLDRALVTRKAMETALLNFGDSAIPHLIGYRAESTDPWIISCILETLSHLTPDARSVSLAIEHLQSPNAEVRSKALKVLGRSGENALRDLAGLVLPLLGDTTWFVRLQAAKTAGMLGLAAAATPLGRLLFDMNWRVRGEAALALTRLGPAAIDIFLEALSTSDGYAKESVCEEIEKAGFSDRLIENLHGQEGALQAKSRDILRTMHRLHFSTPLHAYLADGADERIKQEIRSMVADGSRP